ncbi:MAG: peptide chain release factor N(5)-glutamine methyltransferase [Planctomycetes bacterium]|nr:peptide chain release factor N(5)-glutamine methyltransferase [Planctomycetota bacterium]
MIGKLTKGENNTSADNDTAIVTIRGVIQWAVRELQCSGIDSPRLDAEVILSHLLGCDRTELHTHPEKPVQCAIASQYKKAIQRRVQRTPLQYITHHAEFMSLDFYVNESVLIPRPETELLVEAAIKKANGFLSEDEIIVIDIGVGSGNIAVSLAKYIDISKIYAIDISPEAIDIAKINARKHGVENKITFLCGNIYEPLQSRGIKIKAHFIVSNPPYIASSELSVLQQEVRDYEPHTALISGTSGLEMFERILEDISSWLRPSGFLLLEVAEKQARQIIKMMKNTNIFTSIQRIKDYQNISRILIAQREDNIGQDRN